MLETTPASLVLPLLFRQLILANSHYWLGRVEREAQAVLLETPQLLRALDYVLALEDEAGVVGYKLLGRLSPLMIRQGRFQVWESLLRRGINRSAAENHPAETELRLHLGNIYRLQGRLTEAQPCLEAGLALSERYEDPTHRRTLLNYLGLVARLSGHQEAALDYCRRVVADPHCTPADRSEAFNIMGLVAYDRLEWAEALAHFERALALSRATSDVYDMARLLVNKGIVMQRNNRWEESVSCYGQAIRYFTATTDQTDHFKATVYLGNLFLMQRDYRRAIINYRDALSAFRHYGYFVDLGHIYNTLGLARTGLAEWDTAESYFLSAVEIWQNQKGNDSPTEVLDNLIWLICLLKPVG